jgi:hypothetical protein
VIQLQCPKCRAKLLAPEDKAGKRGNCPRCLEQFRVRLSSLAARTASVSEVHDSWFFSRDGKRKDGPVPFASLKNMAHMGRLRESDMVHQQGARLWFQAGEVPGMFHEVSDERPVAREGSLAPLTYTDEATSSDTDFTACTDCGHMLSTRATRCPACGAVNGWLHPRIQEFINASDQFRHLPPFKIEAHGYSLVGTAEAQHTEVGGKIDLPKSWSDIGDLLLAEIGETGIQAALANVTGSDAHSFYLDLDQETPLWGSTDDYYWRDVKKFFGLA